MDLRSTSAARLVNSAQALIPYYPAPTAIDIDAVLARLCKAFDIPFTVESNAKQLWRKRVGLPSFAEALPARQLHAVLGENAE